MSDLALTEEQTAGKVLVGIKLVNTISDSVNITLGTTYTGYECIYYMCM